MTHDEVRTLFHEFGHVVHRLSGGHQPWYGLSSILMERDFTEAPSQMLEEWVWDPKTLATFASALPDRRADSGGAGAADAPGERVRAGDRSVAQQMVLARVSLSYPRPRSGAASIRTRCGRRFRRATWTFRSSTDTARQASFPHIGQAGYASAYYTYMWSLVIGKDLFSKFEGRDLTQPGIARKYRETIFLPGSSKTATDRRHRVPRPSVQLGRVGEVAERKPVATNPKVSTPAPPAAHPHPPSSA